MEVREEFMGNRVGRYRDGECVGILEIIEQSRPLHHNTSNTHYSTVIFTKNSLSVPTMAVSSIMAFQSLRIQEQTKSRWMW